MYFFQWFVWEDTRNHQHHPTKKEVLEVQPKLSIFVMAPNQRLKLTEPAVDDFAARQYKKIETKPEYVRATKYMELAIRRRSLAAVR